MDDDPTLLDRWRAGDQAAGRALFQRYFDAMYRFFATKCDEPDELVQATFLAIVKAKDQFAGRSSFRTYLYTVARHELYRHCRGKRRDGQFDPYLSTVAGMSTSAPGKLVKSEEHRRLIEAMRALPVEQQTLLELHYWEDLDAAALGEVFELAPGAIRTRLTRARAALREQLEKLAEVPRDRLATDVDLDAYARTFSGLRAS
jgi:RNA polymerase sigma-70 factor (ECF subfamily)